MDPSIELRDLVNYANPSNAHDMYIYISHAFDGSARSIDCTGHLIDQSMGHHLIDALLEWVIIHSIHRLAAI